MTFRHNQKASITSDSVNFKRTNFPSNYLVYINETVSNLRRTTIIRESSLISSLTLLLFKNNNIVTEELKDESRKNMILVQLEGTHNKLICSEE